MVRSRDEGDTNKTQAGDHGEQSKINLFPKELRKQFLDLSYKN